MQIKGDLTREQLLQESDILSLTCHGLERIQAVADLLRSYPHGPLEMSKETVTTAANMIEDSAGEIAYIIELSTGQQRRACDRVKTLERVMENFISYLESPDHEPDRKTMAANLRRKMQ